MCAWYLAIATILHLYPLFIQIHVLLFKHRPNASSVELEMITLTQHHMALRHTPYRSTTWLTTCEYLSPTQYIAVASLDLLSPGIKTG